jgi:broad specificity phosphatase PhoE
MTTKIILTRQGHTDGINRRRFRGREDVPLTRVGTEQAKAAAFRIAPGWRPVAVYTSPMARCVSTGTAIAEVSSVPCQVLPALNDLDYGAWQWKTHEEIAKDFPKDYATWRMVPISSAARGVSRFRSSLQQHHNQGCALPATIASIARCWHRFSINLCRHIGDLFSSLAAFARLTSMMASLGCFE